MKTLTKVLLAITLSTSTCYTFAHTNPVVKVSLYDTQNRNVGSFRGVSLSGSYDVYITQGATESVKVQAPRDVIDRIITDVEGGVLRIYSKNDGFSWGNWFSSTKKVVIYVTVKDVNSISVAGSGDIFFKDGITTNSLKLRVAGSGDILGKVSVKTLDSGVTGSGDIKVSGTADNSIVSVAGSGDFTAPSLTTSNTTVRVVGSGDARVNASSTISASVAGSGDIHYSGTARVVNSSTSGSGDISRS
jgi:hypothetical protein